LHYGVGELRSSTYLTIYYYVVAALRILRESELLRFEMFYATLLEIELIIWSLILIHLLSLDKKQQKEIKEKKNIHQRSNSALVSYNISDFYFERSYKYPIMHIWI